MVQLEFRKVGFWGEGRIGVPREKHLGPGNRTDIKLNPYISSTREFEPGPLLGGSECSHHCATASQSAIDKGFTWTQTSHKRNVVVISTCQRPLFSVILVSFCLTDVCFGSTIKLTHLVIGKTDATLSSFREWFSIKHLRRPNLFYRWQLECESEHFGICIRRSDVTSLVFCTRYNKSLFGPLCLKNNHALGTIEISQVVKCIRFKTSKFSQSPFDCK